MVIPLYHFSLGGSLKNYIKNLNFKMSQILRELTDLHLEIIALYMIDSN
jgi:hypothetical protein